MSKYIPGSMTDEQALATLKSLKLILGRGSAKTMFQQGLMEAICHAVKALEEKVEHDKILTPDCKNCKYSYSDGCCDLGESCSNFSGWEAKDNDR